VIKTPLQLLNSTCLLRNFLFQSRSEIGSALTVSQRRIMKDYGIVTWMKGKERHRTGAGKGLGQTLKPSR